MKFRITVIVVFLMLSIFSLYGQITITGKVTDSENEVLPGATIRERGTNNGTVSNIDGIFNLQVTDSNSTIEVSYLGFKPQGITIGVKRDFLIKLKEDCHIDFFDVKDIWYGLSSDPIHNPIGGFFQITYPFFKFLIGNVGYQSDFSNNFRFDAKLGVIHLFYDCDYDTDFDFNYKNIKIKDKFQFRNYIVESKINFSHPQIFPNNTTLYLGCGVSDIKKPHFSKTTQAGYMLGIGTGKNFRCFRSWASLDIGVKSVYWTNFWEWKGEIVCNINL